MRRTWRSRAVLNLSVGSLALSVASRSKKSILDASLYAFASRLIMLTMPSRNAATSASSNDSRVKPAPLRELLRDLPSLLERDKRDGVDRVGRFRADFFRHCASKVPSVLERWS